MERNEIPDMPKVKLSKDQISRKKKLLYEEIKQKKPAKADVVNLGVSFRHLNVTEKTAKPIDEVIPKIKPINEASDVLPMAIITIPTVAIIIDIHTFKEIFSLLIYLQEVLFFYLYFLLYYN